MGIVERAKNKLLLFYRVTFVEVLQVAILDRIRVDRFRLMFKIKCL